MGLGDYFGVLLLSFGLLKCALLPTILNFGVNAYRLDLLIGLYAFRLLFVLLICWGFCALVYLVFVVCVS